jgi:hypothetical protein
VHAGEALREAAGLGIDDEVDVALPVQQHVFRAVLGDRRKAHLFEQSAERRRIRRRVFDELEAVGSERIVPERRRGHDCHFSCRIADESEHTAAHGRPHPAQPGLGFCPD